MQLAFVVPRPGSAPGLAVTVTVSCLDNSGPAPSRLRAGSGPERNSTGRGHPEPIVACAQGRSHKGFIFWLTC